MTAADTEPFIRKLGNYLHHGDSKKTMRCFVVGPANWLQRMSSFMLFKCYSLACYIADFTDI